MTSPAIGIDLGTTFSCVAVFQHGKAEIIGNSYGNRTTPSYVAFTDTERLIGEVAKGQAARNPKNTVFDAKRMIGRPFSDPKVQQELKLWPFAVVDDCGSPAIAVEYKGEKRRFTPEEISSMLLVRMKEAAEAYLGTKVADAVITVPAYFNNQQRSATADAGKIAGLNVRRIINEPTAAALAYGLDKDICRQRKVLIFDLGGGTFDVSILKISKESVFEVLATAGDTHLGGQDFDNRMVSYFADEFKKRHGKDLMRSAAAVRKLKTACEQAKRTLSSASLAFIEIDSLYQGIYFRSKISRARFEDLCIDLFRRTLKPVEQAMCDAKLEKSAIDKVVLVGGSTRIAKVQQLLKDFFDGKKLNMDINPDEAVAYGAAVQAATLSSDASQPINNVLIHDIIPLSVGIEVGGVTMEKVIERNTAIPVRRQKTFSVACDNQDAARIRVLEGERARASDNSLLCEFTLNGLAPRRRGDPAILVIFDIDANGILRVSAADDKTGKSDQVIISEQNGRLKSADIERMINEAEQFRAEDEALLTRVASKGQLERYVLSIHRAVEEAGDRLSADNKKKVFKTCHEALNWIDNNSLAEKDELDYWMQKVKEEVSPVMGKIGWASSMGQQQQATSDSGASSAGRSGASASGASSAGGSGCFRESGRSQGDNRGQEEVSSSGDRGGMGGLHRGAFGCPGGMGDLPPGVLGHHGGLGDLRRGAMGRRGGPAAFEQALRDAHTGEEPPVKNIPSYPTSDDFMNNVD